MKDKVVKGRRNNFSTAKNVAKSIVGLVGPTTTIASIIMGLVVGLMTIKLGYVIMGGLAGLTAGILFVIVFAQFDGKDSPWPPLGFCLIYSSAFLVTWLIGSFLLR